MKYKLVLDTFEGPLDLLYHLIEKNKVDIYDIPIAQITEQYMAYLNSMKELDLEIASEFLVMASTLLEIKSRMLLPKHNNVEGKQLEIEDVDPRDELVKKLIEYKKYKNVALELKNKEEIQKKIYYKSKEEISEYNTEELPKLENIQLKDLVKAFSKVISKSKYNENIIKFKEIHKEEITIEDKMKNIIDIISKKKKVKFEELFEGDKNRSMVVITFLSILELIKLKKITVNQKDNFKPIIISIIN